jgi:hypothetical protein
VLVADQRGGVGLAVKALDQLGALGEVGVQRLDRDPTTDQLVLALVDGAHAAFAELAHDAVAALQEHADAGVRGNHDKAFELACRIGVKPATKAATA